MYEILTGRPPRQGSSEWELLDLARTSRPIAPRKLDPRVPRALDAICLKAISFHKRDRYVTALALADDMQRFLSGEPTSAYRERWTERTARWLRRHRRGLARAAVVAALMVLAVVAGHHYRQARLLTVREQGRSAWNRFRHLFDEAQFYAANTDAVSERVPFYDPGRAGQIGQSALAIADAWGTQGERPCRWSSYATKHAKPGTACCC